MNRQRMDAALQLGGKRRIDQAMPLDPGLSPEGLRHDINPEMRLTARPVACMALVLVRFIDNPQGGWGESPGQLFCDHVGGAHRRALEPAGLTGQPRN